MEFGSVSRVKCPACAKTCPHKVLFTSDGVDHLRCSECENVGVFAVEMGDRKEAGDKKKKWSSIDHVGLMERRNSKTSNPYSVKTDYTGGDYLSHPKFGAGYVLTALPPNKMEVLFADQRKLLICGPGSTSGMIKTARSNRKSPQNVEQAIVSAKNAIPRNKAETHSVDGTTECPICGATSHPYNLRRNPQGKVVACMNCSGK